MTSHNEDCIVLDRGIPIPETRGRPSQYPWTKMDVGDSFLFPDERTRSVCYQNAANASKRLGRKFITRCTKEGYRCWRIA
jgi:hypothetical protein